MFERSGKKSSYQERINAIRNPEINHMSRTRVKIDQFVNKDKSNPGVSKNRRKKGFAGAFVANPRKQVPSGYTIGGMLMKHIHDFVIDMDLTSLYPSIMILMNLSNDSFFGKVMLQNPKKFNIPIYASFIFDDKAKEREEYSQDPSNFMMEVLSGGHFTILFEMFCEMPSVIEILDHIEKNMKDFSK